MGERTEALSRTDFVSAGPIGILDGFCSLSQVRYGCQACVKDMLSLGLYITGTCGTDWTRH